MELKERLEQEVIRWTTIEELARTARQEAEAELRNIYAKEVIAKSERPL